jgi:hypothetical protein
MIQFNNLLYFELAAFFSLILLILSFFTMKRVKCFKKRDIIRSLMWSGIILFSGMAMAGAKLNREISQPVKEKMEIIFALDGSLSSLAQDVEIKNGKEGKKISRFEFGKRQIEDLIDLFKKDAIGLIVFAGKAIPLQIVLSREDRKNSILRNLKYIDDDFIRRGIKQGTDYGILLMAAIEQFGENDVKKILVVLTDGEPQGNEEELRQNLAKALDLFSERKDIAVYFIAVGNTAEPSKIPKIADKDGNIEYYTHENGQPVLTRPNPEFLIDLANATGGRYIHPAPDQNLENIMLTFIEEERTIIDWEKKTQSVDLTPYLLICSLIFLFVIPILKTV